jgi:glycosyltransferase involved in cell wall biosynthesis
MNLLFVTNVFPNPVDRTKGLFNHYIARALAADHRVNVVAPISWLDELRGGSRRSSPMPPERAETVDGVAVHYPRYFYPPKILRSTYGAFYWQSVRNCVRRAMDHCPPDVVLSFWAYPDGEAAIRSARERDVPAVVVVGGSDVLLLSNNSGGRNRVARVLRSADAVVAVSSDLRNKICALGISAEKVRLWQRGIESDVFCPGDRMSARRRLGVATTERVLVWVGRMVPVKGLDVLLDACSLLQKQEMNLRVYLVGDGPLRNQLERTSRARGLDPLVSFVGSRLHNELPDWYRAADLTVLPSRSEGLPNVLRESLACGTPYVASRVGGIAELGTSLGQILVPPGDAASLAAAIAESLEKGERPAVEIRCSTSWSESGNAFVRILESVLRRPVRSRVLDKDFEAAIP